MKYEPKISIPNQNGQYECSICGKRWTTDLYRIACEKGHDVIYFPIKREDVFKLVQFFFTLDKDLIPVNFIKDLMKVTRVKDE